MRNRHDFSPPAVGGSALLVIFAVLCLTVFALLSLSSVQAERRLADASVQAVADYYEAELQAQTIFGRLRGGETVAGVEMTDGVYKFQIPISRRQTLTVELRQEGEQWTVLRWQAVASEGGTDDNLDVWKGSEEESP